jgi:hypothetical protein
VVPRSQVAQHLQLFDADGVRADDMVLLGILIIG